MKPHLGEGPPLKPEWSSEAVSLKPLGSEVLEL